MKPEIFDAESIIVEFKKMQTMYLEKFKSGSGLIGLSTGYEKIDAVVDGLRPSHFWIIGGYTSMGKTFAALNITAHLILQGKRVAIYSLEMSQIEILSRLIGIMTKQSGLTVLKGFKHDAIAVQKAFEAMVKSRLVIHTEKTDLREIEVAMWVDHKNQPVDLFIVDFLQNVTVENAKSEYETVTTATLRLQKHARRLKIPIIALSQVSNDGARNQNQDVMSFKGSGAIASAADFAIEIVKFKGQTNEEYIRKIKAGEPTSVSWIIRKNRHGKSGTLDMDFDTATGIFTPSEFEKL